MLWGEYEEITRVEPCTKLLTTRNKPLSDYRFLIQNSGVNYDDVSRRL
jgi:hypothetical protein